MLAKTAFNHLPYTGTSIDEGVFLFLPFDLKVLIGCKFIGERGLKTTILKDVPPMNVGLTFEILILPSIISKCPVSLSSL